MQKVSNMSQQGSKNSGDNVFRMIPVGQNELSYVRQFIESQDYSPHTVRAFYNDLRKFSYYFITMNNEPFEISRVTTTDITSFKRHLRHNLNQSVATVNRALVSLRKYLSWLVTQNILESNPATVVKELRQQALVPKGLERPQVRKLLRETELRQDIRARAIFLLFLHTGCRVSDLVQTEIQNIQLQPRCGTILFRHGKGGKQRQCPLPLIARSSLEEYLSIRPPIKSDILFVGERGPLTDKGVRTLCYRYSAYCGFKIYPHLLRHTMAHQFLRDNSNDITALAQILGHQNLQTTSRYTQRHQQELATMAENLSY